MPSLDVKTGVSYTCPMHPQVRHDGPGNCPICGMDLEPVKATVSIAGRPIAAVNVLDHDGRRTGRALPVRDGAFTLDGAKDKAIYYEVMFR